MGADAGRGAHADHNDMGGKGSGDSRKIPRSASFSSSGTDALGDAWLGDARVPMDVSDGERHNRA